ncbi:MAG: hypothetical protein WCG45_03735 [bacterium]
MGEEENLLNMQEQIHKKGIVEEKPVPVNWNYDCIEGITYDVKNIQRTEKKEDS